MAPANRRALALERASCRSASTASRPPRASLDRGTLGACAAAGGGANAPAGGAAAADRVKTAREVRRSPCIGQKRTVRYSTFRRNVGSLRVAVPVTSAGLGFWTHFTPP